MTRFLGNHQSKLDAKGRVSVPASFRALLKAQAGSDTDGAPMILRLSHQRPCIEVWPAAAFQALAAQLDQLDVFSEAHDDLATSLFSDSFAMEPDKEGRIVLPERFLRHAGITETMEFMGTGKHFQIWHPDAAERRRAEANERTRLRGLTIPGIGTNGSGTNANGTNGGRAP
jgi:MraZ protein